MARSDDSAARGAHDRGRGRSGLESVALVAIGVVLLGVAAWSASRARLGSGSANPSATVRGGQAALNDAILVAVGALAAAVVILVAPAFLRARRVPAMAGAETPRPQFWLRIAVGIVVLFAIVLAVMLAARNRPDQTQPLAPPPAPTEEISPPPGGTRAGAHGWTATALAAAGAIAVVTAIVVWRRRGRGRGSLRDVDYRALTPRPAEPVDFSALDPTEAIRAAYAAVRQALVPMGVSSRPPETPYEYLDRVRASAPNFEGPVATLTRLFEIARFSHHPVTPQMKIDAIAAYDTVVAELARERERDEAVLT